MGKAYRTIQSSKYEGKVARKDVAAAVLLVSRSDHALLPSKKAPAKKLAAKTAARPGKTWSKSTGRRLGSGPQ